MRLELAAEEFVRAVAKANIAHGEDRDDDIDGACAYCVRFLARRTGRDAKALLRQLAEEGAKA